MRDDLPGTLARRSTDERRVAALLWPDATERSSLMTERYRGLTSGAKNRCTGWPAVSRKLSANLSTSRFEHRRREDARDLNDGRSASQDLNGFGASELRAAYASRQRRNSAA